MSATVVLHCATVDYVVGASGSAGYDPYARVRASASAAACQSHNATSSASAPTVETLNGVRTCTNAVIAVAYVYTWQGSEIVSVATTLTLANISVHDHVASSATVVSTRQDFSVAFEAAAATPSASAISSASRQAQAQARMHQQQQQAPKAAQNAFEPQAKAQATQFQLQPRNGSFHGTIG